MRYLFLAVLVTGSAALIGCSDSDNNDFDFDNQNENANSVDQANAQLAVDRTSDVIDASNDVNTDEPQDIDRIILPEANTAEPVAITDANASL
ncbi:hypothetical protein ACS8FD_07820 [Psychrobacter sp. 1U2]|uniref:hypothetical protein n=1 Tax=Psychrobacter sp. 1U2 TaxID=3453577 RepID=UPI003F48FAD9